MALLPGAGPPTFSCGTGRTGFPGWGTGARGGRTEGGGEFDSQTGIPKRGQRSTEVESTAFSPTPHSGALQGGSRGVEGVGASESLRPRVRAPNERTLQGGSRGAGSPESWGTRRSGPGDPWAPRRLRTRCCGGKGFKAARFPSHVAPRAFYLGIAGTAGSQGASWARKSLTPVPPIAPYGLSALKPNAAWVLFGSLPA